MRKSIWPSVITPNNNTSAVFTRVIFRQKFLLLFLQTHVNTIKFCNTSSSLFTKEGSWIVSFINKLFLFLINGVALKKHCVASWLSRSMTCNEYRDFSIYIKWMQVESSNSIWKFKRKITWKYFLWIFLCSFWYHVHVTRWKVSEWILTYVHKSFWIVLWKYHVSQKEASQQVLCQMFSY